MVLLPSKDTTTQSVIWTFVHPIRISSASDIFNNITPNGSGEYFLNGNTAGDLTKITDAFIVNIDPAGADSTTALTNGGGDTNQILTLSHLKANDI